MWGSSVTLHPHEDCGRCGASLEWLAENGCPFGTKTIWCLLVNSGEDRQKPPDSGELKQTPPFS